MNSEKDFLELTKDYDFKSLDNVFLSRLAIYYSNHNLNNNINKTELIKNIMNLIDNYRMAEKKY